MIVEHYALPIIKKAGITCIIVKMCATTIVNTLGDYEQVSQKELHQLREQLHCLDNAGMLLFPSNQGLSVETQGLVNTNWCSIAITLEVSIDSCHPFMDQLYNLLLH